jgi:toxin CcdB
MRYDIFANGGGPGYLLNVQSDLLDRLHTRVVVPLLPAHEAPAAATRLNPLFVIGGANYIMVTQFLAAVPVTSLSEPAGNLMPHHDSIVAALDMLFQGF